MNNKQHLYTLPIPVGYTCKPQNLTVVGQSVCFISTTGTGRFWPAMDKPTNWFEFKITLDAEDFIHQLHSDASKIGAVSNKGVLYNVYVQNSTVKYNVHKRPDRRGWGRRVSSMFWSSQGSGDEENSISLLIGGVFVICVNQTVFGWELDSNSINCSFVASYSDIFGNAKLVSIAGNGKYIGFLMKNADELSYLIGPFDSFMEKFRDALDSHPVSFSAGGRLKLLMPYLSQVAVASPTQIWLSNSSNVDQEDKILAAGVYDGQVAIITERGLRLSKTKQKISQNLSDTMPEIRNEYSQMNNIEKLEQMSQSEVPKERLLAAFIQFNQSNMNEAEQLLQSIGDLDSAVSDVSREIIDEIPSHDPRWNRGLSKSNGNQSLLIQKQIQEKISKHSLFISFVKPKLSPSTLAVLAQVILSVRTLKV